MLMNAQKDFHSTQFFNEDSWAYFLVFVFCFCPKRKRSFLVAWLGGGQQEPTTSVQLELRTEYGACK